MISPSNKRNRKLHIKPGQLEKLKLLPSLVSSNTDIYQNQPTVKLPAIMSKSPASKLYVSKQGTRYPYHKEFQDSNNTSIELITPTNQDCRKGQHQHQIINSHDDCLQALQKIIPVGSDEVISQKKIYRIRNLKQFDKDKEKVEVIKKNEKESNNSQISQSSDSVNETTQSVVWDDDDLKVRGIFEKCQQLSPLNQFMELYKYRYESYPNSSETITNHQVEKTTRGFIRMNKKLWNKYRKQKIEFNSNEDYTKPYDPLNDQHFLDFQQYFQTINRKPRQKHVQNDEVITNAQQFFIKRTSNFKQQQND